MKKILAFSIAAFCFGCTQDPRPEMIVVSDGSTQEERADHAVAVSQELWDEGFPTSPCDGKTRVNPDDPNEISAYDLLITPTIENDGTVYLHCSISDQSRYDYILKQCRQRVLEKLRS